MGLSRSLVQFVFGVGVVWYLAAAIAERCDAGEARIVKVIHAPDEYKSLPIINDRGDVVFLVADENGTEIGIWMRSSDGTVRHWLRSNSEVPEVPSGVPLQVYPHSLRLNHHGQIAFRGSWRDEDSYGTAIWLLDEDLKPKTVVVERTEAPDTDGLLFGHLNDPLVLTSRKQPVLFFDSILVNRPGKGEAGRRAFDTMVDQRRSVWARRWDEDPRLVYDESERAADFASAINDRGDFLIAPKVSRGRERPVELRLFDGPRLEIVHPNDSFLVGKQAFSLHHAYRVSLNSNRDVALLADIRADRRVAKALLLYDGGTIKPILYDGAPLEGITSQAIEINSQPDVNEHGNVLFFPTACLYDVPPTILFAGKNQEPKVLVDATSPAPGTTQPFLRPPKAATDTGIDIEGLTGGKASPFTSVQFNDRDQVAFVGQLAGDATAENHRGIWFIDTRRNQTHLVVRTGDALNLPSGETKTVSNVLMMNDTDRLGLRALNSRGVLTYALSFKDGSVAFVVDDRFAIASDTDELTDSLRDVDRSVVEQNCEKWEQLADSYLNFLDEQVRQSDQTKLEQLASGLRGEYSATQRRLESLLSLDEQHELTPQDYVAAVKSLQIRLRELPAIWNALANWKFYQVPAFRSSEEREFIEQTLELLKDYDSYASLSERVKTKSDQLQVLQVSPIRAASVNGRTPWVDSSTQGFRAAVFQEPLGTLARGLLPELPVVTEDNDGADTRPIEGPLGEVRQPLSQFAKFAIQADGRLAIDRKSWTEQTGSLVELRAGRLAYKYLKDAHIREQVLMPAEDAQRPFPRGQDWMHFPEVSPGMELFVRIQELTSDPEQSSYNSGIGDGTESISFETAKLTGRLRIVDGLFRFQLSEVTAPWRVIEFEAREKDEFRLVVVVEDNCFILSQSPAGAIRCAITKPESALVKTAKNFAELYRTEPEFVKKEIIDYLDRLGMRGPATPEGAAFRAAVVRRLRSRLPGVRQAAEEAIQALNSPEYDHRQAAFLKLSKNAELYQPVLEEYLKNNQEIESRVQLERLVAFAQDQTGEYDALIDAFDSLESKSQLEEIKKDANDEERLLIDAQLRQIKGS